ncbi:MAG TPA: hypothetical protein PK637_00305 [Flavobacteriales bacterium]|nr:hypothetical protein [Flavobacteriales bacterium]HRE95172.1 hypothetical protein [Flavobacteriales bacterium]HRJ39415.1 hypothetical protein [Flavobacteriales bacterium]
MEKIEFAERQRFTQIWIWLLLLGINGLIIWGIVQQIGYGLPFGNKPVPNTGLVVIFILVNLFTFFFIFLSMRTRIDEKGMHVRFFPFHRKERSFLWTDINRAYIRQYRPIAEYGGWGLRVLGRFGAYNVSGDTGVQLELKNGGKILIGTQKKDEIIILLRKYGFGE